MATLNEVGGVVAAWVMTYALHSTLLLGAAWLANRKLALGVSRREVMWKAATIGGFVTTTLQASLIGWNHAKPVAGRYALIPPTEIVQPMVSTNAIEGPVAQAADEPQLPSTATARGFDYPLSWPSTLVLLWLTGVVVQLARLHQRRRRMFDRLGVRAPLRDSQLWEMLESVKARANVARDIRISVSQNNVSPVVISAREICLPGGLLPRLTVVQCESMLAHEVAHIARRDPQWLMTYAWLEALFFFQPLNRHARMQVQSAAEYLCDDWATRHVARVALAQCLVEVARWMTHSPEPLPHPAMAEHGSILFSRIERLLDGSRELTPSHAGVWWSVPIALIAVTVIAPAVTRTSGVRLPAADIPTTDVQESPIARTVREVGNGVVRFEFPARASVCGTGVERDGTRMIALQPDGDWQPAGSKDRLALYVSDTRKLMRNDVGRDGQWTTPCQPGNGRVDLFVRDRRITNIEVTVSTPAPAITGKSIDLKVLAPRTAADYLMAIADSLDGTLGERALLGAVIARDAVPTAVLVRLAALGGGARIGPVRNTSDLRGYLGVIADLKESFNTRRQYLQQATYEGLTPNEVIAAYDRVPDRAMRVELIQWMGERRNPSVVRKLQQIVRDAVVLEEQQAALAVLAQQPRSSNSPLGDRFANVQSGIARFRFAARPEACGSGVDRDGAGMFALLPTDDWHPAGSPGQAAFFSFDDDDFSRLSLSPEPGWTRNCQNGPVYVDLSMRDGRIANLQISVGNPARAVNAASLTDAGEVSSADAAGYLLGIARSAGVTIAGNAILAAVMAKDVAIDSQLRAIAADYSRPPRVRQTAAHWAGLEPSIGSGDTQLEGKQELALRVAVDERQPLETRKQAILWADDSGVEPAVIASLYDQLPKELKLFLIEWMADCDEEATARKLIDIARNDSVEKLRIEARRALTTHKHPLARSYR